MHSFCLFYFMPRSPTCPQCNIKITKLSKVFVSFTTDFGSRNDDEIDKDLEIALLSSQVTAAEKVQHYLKKYLFKVYTPFRSLIVKLALLAHKRLNNHILKGSKKKHFQKLD